MPRELGVRTSPSIRGGDDPAQRGDPRFWLNINSPGSADDSPNRSVRAILHAAYSRHAFDLSQAWGLQGVRER